MWIPHQSSIPSLGLNSTDYSLETHTQSKLKQFNPTNTRCNLINPLGNVVDGAAARENPSSGSAGTPWTHEIKV